MEKNVEEILDIYKWKEKELQRNFGFFSGGTLLTGVLSAMEPSIAPMLCVGNGFLLGRFLQTFYQFRKSDIFRPDVYMSSLEYQNVLEVYQYFLKDFAIFSKKLDWDNEMKVFAGYCYLLKQGYLSLEHQFYYARGLDFSFGVTGSTVISGFGNCKHINFLLTDLLNACDFRAYNLSIFLDKETIFLNDMSMKEFVLEEKILKKYEENISKGNINFGILMRRLSQCFRKPMNHIVTLFTDGEHSYGMDACNDTIFLNDSKNLYQRDQKFFCQYDSYCNDGKKEKLSTIMFLTDLKKINELVGDYYQVWDRCFESIDIFEQFYLEHKELYTDIVDKKKILIRELKKS